MASEIKLIAQPRNGSGNPTTFDYKPGAKHPADANNFYKIMVDGKEELPVGTKISRKGNSLVFDFPDGTNFTIDDWCSVSDSRLTELVNGEAYSVSDAGYVPAKDIDSGTCMIWAGAGQAGAVLGDSSAAPVAGTPPPAGGDDHATAGIIAAILGVGALAAAAGSSGGGGGGGDSPDKVAPTAGTPDALNEDFSPTTITAAAIKASDDRGANQIQIVSAKIKSADGFNFSDDNDPTNDDVQIVDGKDGPVLQLTESGANKFGTVTTTIQLKDAAGNVSDQEVVFTVNAVNDTPVNNAASPVGPISSFTETLGKSADPQFAGLNLSVSDADETTGPAGFKIGTVTLDLTDGTLAVTTPGNVTVSGDAKHLVLTGSQQDINLALDSILWSNNPVNNTTRDVIITMTTVDNGGERDVDVITIVLDESVGASHGGNGGGFPAAASQSSSLANLIGNLHEQVPPSA